MREHKSNMHLTQAKEEMQENFPYRNPAIYNDGRIFFPIVATGLTYIRRAEFLKDDMLEPQKAYFSLCLKPTISDVKVESSLREAGSAGMKVFIFNRNFILNVDNQYYKLIQQPDLKEWMAGIDMQDEPYYNQLIGGGKNYDNKYTLLEEYEILKQLEPSTLRPLILINLQGFASGERMPTDEEVKTFLEKHPEVSQICKLEERDDAQYSDECKYDVYLSAYQEYFKPSFFCYDLYPISEINTLVFQGIKDSLNGKDGDVKVFYNDFYNRLKQYHDIAEKYNRPFWTYLKSMCFLKAYEDKDNESKSDYNYSPPALEQYLRYAAFSALAYGAKGLLYWCYAPGPGDQDSVEHYFTALTNWRNEKTAVWHFARKINMEIQSFKDIFLNTQKCILDQIYNNMSPHQVSTISMSDSYYGITILGINRENPVTSNGTKTYITNIIVTRLIDTNIAGQSERTYLMVVNTSPLEYTSFNIFVNTQLVIERTPRRSGEEPTDRPLTPGVFLGRHLAPGGYRIFEILKEYPV